MAVGVEVTVEHIVSYHKLSDISPTFQIISGKNKVSVIITISRNSVRMMFFNFSSAFNTIQPHLLANKMLSMSVPSDMMLWIIDYLAFRSQFVVFQSLKSDTLYSNTGVPQGTVLAPLLLILYTSDCRSSNKTCSIVKFADDTMLIGLISYDDGSKYVNEINKFTTYCLTNFLDLCVKMTKEMIIDFRKSKALPDPIIINDHTVERVTTYECLGIMLNNDLSWSNNTDYIISRLNSLLYCLRKLKNFNVNISILKLFYQLVIKSVFTYCCVCWGGNITKRDINKITGIIKKSGSVIQSNKHSDFSMYYKNAIQCKYQAILKDQNHIYILNSTNALLFVVAV